MTKKEVFSILPVSSNAIKLPITKYDGTEVIIKIGVHDATPCHIVITAESGHELNVEQDKYGFVTITPHKRTKLES